MLRMPFAQQARKSKFSYWKDRIKKASVGHYRASIEVELDQNKLTNRHGLTCWQFDRCDCPKVQDEFNYS